MQDGLRTKRTRDSALTTWHIGSVAQYYGRAWRADRRRKMAEIVADFGAEMGNRDGQALTLLMVARLGRDFGPECADDFSGRLAARLLSTKGA